MFSCLAISKLSADYIHEYTIDLYYANGVKANARNSVSEDWTYRSNDLKAKYPSLNQALKYGEAKLSYNASYLWGIGDFAETIIQYRNEHPAAEITWQALTKFVEARFKVDLDKLVDLLGKITSEATLSEQTNAYMRSVEQGHGVVTIAHSQGNFFTNEAFNRIITEAQKGWMKPYLHMISVASPSKEVFNNGPHVTFDNDVIAALYSMPTTHINPNRDRFRNALGEVVDDFSINFHGFDYYMGEEVSYTDGFGAHTVSTQIAKADIEKYIIDALDAHLSAESQWEKAKDYGCLCKDKRIIMKHKWDTELTKELSTTKVFEFDKNGKLYHVLNQNKTDLTYVTSASRDGASIEDTIEDNACYALTSYENNRLGIVEGQTGSLPQPKSGVVEVTLTWNNPAIDFDLNVGWNAGEHDVKDTGCSTEHFYIERESLIYPGTYPITVAHKKLDDNESTLIPEKVQMTIQVPGKIEVYDIDINTADKLDVGHVADIFVKYINNEIVSSVSPDPIVAAPTISIPTTGDYGNGNSGGGSIGSSGGSSSGNSSISTPWVYIDSPSCNQSCGCIPCEYRIIPYLEQLLYGPISGADVALYEARDYANKSPLYVGKTSTGNTLYSAGNIEIPDSIVNGLQDDTLYLLIAKGGIDIDHNDDFEIDNTPTLNQGETHLLLSGKDIKEIGVKMNVLTEIAYQVTKDMIDVNTAEEVQNKLNEVAQRLLKDKIYGDIAGGINYKDLSFWMPSIHKTLLVKEYDRYFTGFVNNLFANQDIYQEAYAIVYEHASAVPILQSIRLDASEDINSSTVIGKVPVLNQGTSKITSFMLEGDGSDNFVIDTNGEVSVAQGAQLDYESKTYYQLYVSAINDEGISQKVLLLIQLHNVTDAPEYSSFTASTFYENAAIGTDVLSVLYDVGSSPLQSVQLTGKDSTYFKAEVQGNTVFAKTNQPLLNYATKRAYELQIQATNNLGTSKSLPIVLQASDRRDIPRLNDTRLRVDENATAGTVVGKVNIVSDGYSPITHFTLQKPYYYNIWPDGYFTLDDNGTVRIGENAVFDYEGRKSYSAYIKAVNAIGESQLKIISVDLNNIPDVLPSFKDTTPLEIRINKEASQGALLKNFQFYHGDNPVSFIELSPASPFEAVLDMPNSYNAQGFIKIKDSLRDTQVYEYNLTAVVINSVGRSNEKPIHITVNQESYEFSVLEGTYNTVIGKIDFGSEAIQSVIYPLNKYFTLDSNGTLSTVPYRDNRTPVLNHTGESQFSFTATIFYKNGTSKNVGITINVLSRIIATLDTPGTAKKIVLNQAKNRAYVADYDRGLQIIDVSSSTNPKIIASLDTDGAANDVVLSKDEQYVYLLDVGKGLKIIDISNETTPYVASEVALAGYSFNIALSSDKSLAFVSHGTSGIKVIDIVDPTSPAVIKNIGFLGTLEDAGQNSHYQIVQPGGYSYVLFGDDRLYGVDWSYGLRVIDIHDIQNPINIYAESLISYSGEDNKYVHSATNFYLHQEQKLISVINTNDNPSLLYSTKENGRIKKLKIDYDSDDIELFDGDIAYMVNYTLIGFDAYNPTALSRLLYLDIGRSHGLVLNKEQNIAYVANDQNGLRIIDLSGIAQPVHHESVLVGTDISISEQNLSSITVDDILGSITILKSGDSPISQIQTTQSTHTSGYLSGTPDCGYTYYAASIDKQCEYDYSYFNVDEIGNIYINNMDALLYENVGNMVPFSVYAENGNGHKSNQAKVLITIQR